MPLEPRLDQLTRLDGVRSKSSPVTCTVKSTLPVVDGILTSTVVGLNRIQFKFTGDDVVVLALVSVIVLIGISVVSPANRDMSRLQGLLDT